ncbi:hypothetical protein NMZ80_06620 [Clostridioides difficile]|nr:hypothetical protein [Clostridioides difficile]UUC43115.1 hypothetical protein NMZ80_06620 [Clostridioides difficile]
MVQEYSDPTYIGRMFSYADLFSTLVTPLGMMIFAPLSSINLDFPFILPSIALLLLGIWTFKKAKLFKNIQ